MNSSVMSNGAPASDYMRKLEKKKDDINSQNLKMLSRLQNQKSFFDPIKLEE
jgi:hypothetical protein